MTDHAKQLAWHFLAEDRRLRYGDRRLVGPGDVLHHYGDPVLCESGLHASVRLIDALKYAPGAIVCRVEIGGTTVRGDGKIVGTSRRVIWMADATDCLRAFARRCALDVIHLWDAPDVVRRFLETGDESIREAAWVAARDAARADARADAWADAWAAGCAIDAACAAARDAACADAWAAGYATGYTAGDAACADAWAAGYATGYTAGDAACADAWAAAVAAVAAGYATRAKQNRRLTAMVSRLPRITA